MNWRHLLILAVMLACALAGLSFRWQPAAPRATSDSAATGAPVPDVVIHAPVLDHFDEQGARRYHATGDTLQHFDNTQQSVIAQPRIQLYRHDNASADAAASWHIQADQGVMDKTQNQMHFSGHVVVDNPAQETTIRTEQLSVDPQREFATTDKAVNIRARRSVADATGLQADLNSEQLRLPGRVKETHEVKQH